MVQVDLGVDLGDVKSSFTLVPAGVYNAKIIKAELGDSQQGNKMIKMQLEITEGEFAGSKLFDNCPLVEKAMWKLKAYAELIGLESGSSLDTRDFVGVECVVTVEHRMYNDEPQASIKKIAKVG